jgi:hypothetical protein
MESKVGLLVISTGKYDQFVQPLIDSIEDNFFRGHTVDVYLFTDKPAIEIETRRINLFIGEIPSYKFPWATLYRYKIITQFSEWIYADYLFYIDVDMLFCGRVSEEILFDGLTAVLHPGYFKNNGWGSKHTHHQSLAYLPASLQHHYYCGGFQGGRRKDYLEAAAILSEMIEIDLDTARDMGYGNNNGILAEYHDETFWNWYLKTMDPLKVKTLTPAYCMVEEMELRQKWGIADIDPLIIALKKNHKEVRE